MGIFDNVKLPKVIYETSSKFNGKVEVWEVGKTHKLVSNGTVQSINWDSPNASRMVFGKVVEVLKEHQPVMKNVLIMGLGGGAMQRLISNAYPKAEIVSVEIDEVMIDIARNYFKLDEIPNHKVICEDALRVIIEPEKYGLTLKSFDALIVDIYCGDKFPDLGHTGNFLASLNRFLTPGGLIIFNRLYLDSHQDDVDHFITDLEGFYNDVDTLTVAGKTNSDNILIFGRSKSE
jgi:spermidine synthase